MEVKVSSEYVSVWDTSKGKKGEKTASAINYQNDKSEQDVFKRSSVLLGGRYNEKSIFKYKNLLILRVLCCKLFFFSWPCPLKASSRRSKKGRPVRISVCPSL